MVVLVARRGVDIVSDQPVEVLVSPDTDGLHLFLGDVQAVCVKVAEDHHVLEEKRRRNISTCVYREPTTNQI